MWLFAAVSRASVRFVRIQPFRCHGNLVDQLKCPELQIRAPSLRLTARSHTCGELRPEHIGQLVSLCGWVHRLRFSKFLILRDAYGVTQVYLDPAYLHDPRLPPLESVVQVTGIVTGRPSKDVNKSMSTGDVEVIAHNLHVLSEVETELAFPVTSQNPANEFLRLQYRYLDLRSEVLQRNLRFRSTFILTIRQFLCLSYGFLEVETPYLFRKTPGGANEFLTPTTYPGLFYSLPQSPQQFKQLLMVGGFDRYMQIARCFRDEPSRSDRQPEFTQLDLELAFANATDIMQIVEDLLLHVWPLVRNIRKDDCLLQTPFPKITYSAAISQFGSDKPDIRFAFRFCKPSANGCVGFKIPLSTASMISEPDWKRLTENTYLNTGVNIYFNTPCSSSSDFDCLSKSLEAEPSDTIVFVRDHTEKELKALGLARTMLAEVLHAKGVPIYEPGIHFLWVDNFPLFERIDDDSWSSVHHPFTAPTPDTLSFIYSNPEKVVSQHYDLVCNGQEVGGGSIRIHDASIQEYVLSDILKEDTKTMSYFMTALRSGAPPHGGIALGLDRLLAILLNANSIREVIAFPKASDGKDLMSGAPAHISEDDLKRYNLAVTAK